MNLLQQQVRHRQFGTGRVTGQQQSVITVQFDPPYGEKNFLCPAAFEQFLSLTDAQQQQLLQAELDQLHLQAELERKAREEEQARVAAARLAELAARKKTTRRTRTKKS